MYKTINEYHDMINQENQLKNEQNYSVDQFQYEQALDLNKSRNSKQTFLKVRSSIVQKDDPLCIKTKEGL